MNIRTNIILFGVLGLTLLLFYYTMGLKTPEERRLEGQFLFPSLNSLTDKTKPTVFTRIELKRTIPAAETLVFARQGSEGPWRLVEPINVRTESHAVEALLGEVMGLKRLPTSERLSGKIEDYGLGSPVVTVTLFRGGQGNEPPAVLKLGQHRADRAALLFAASSEAPDTPAEVNRAALETVFQPREYFRARDLLADPFPHLAKLRIEQAGKDPLELEAAAEDDWRIKVPPRGYAERLAIENLTKDLTQLRVEPNGFRDNLDEAKLKELGLAPASSARYVVTLQSKGPDPKHAGVAQTLTVGHRDKATDERLTARRGAALTFALSTLAGGMSPLDAVAASAAAAGAEKLNQDHEGLYYAKVGSDPYAVLVRAQGLAALAKPIDEYRSKHLARIDLAKVDAIDIVFPKGDIKRLEIRRPSLRPGSHWDLYSDTRAKVKTDDESMKLLLGLLRTVEAPNMAAFFDSEAKKSEFFRPEPVDLGLASGFEQAEIRIWHGGLRRTAEGGTQGADRPEFKEDRIKTPDLVLRLGRRDAKRGYVYVERKIGDMPPSEMAVLDPWTGVVANQSKLSLSEVVAAGYYGFRERDLPTFKPEAADSFTLTRGSETLEFVRDAGAPWGWKIAKPFEANANNLRGAFSILSDLRADAILTDRPNERDLKEQFGLADGPLLRYTFKSKAQGSPDKFDEYVYTVGKRVETEGQHKGKFYARVEHKPATGNPPESNQFVLLLVPKTVEQLAVEPRDPVIFSAVEKMQPNEITVTWRKLNAEKKVEEIKLELTGKAEKPDTPPTWTIKSLTGADAKMVLPSLSQPSVFGLTRRFGSISKQEIELKVRGQTLSTQRFLQYAGDPPANSGLNPADMQNPPALVIEVKYDDGKTVRTLTVGNTFEPNATTHVGLAGKQHYAAANTVPGVFVLPDAGLKELTAGPATFKGQ